MGAETSPGEQQYSLRWNDFHSSILSSFRHLRDEEDFVDVTLACDGCSFTAHKVVLSACSPYFRRLLKANPCQHPIVILRDVQQKDMESLLRFMYNGEVHIGQEHLTDFLKTAQMLQVRGLADVPAGAAPARLNSISDKMVTSPSPFPWPASERRVIEEERGATGTSPPAAKRARSSERGGSCFTPDQQGRTSTPAPASSNGGDVLPESLLGQALEGGPTILTKERATSDSSLQAGSADDDSNDGSGGEASDAAASEPPATPKTEPPDYPDHPFGGTNGGLMGDHAARGAHAGFPLLGLQGLGGLMPGPSGMHNSTNDFDGSSRASTPTPTTTPAAPRCVNPLDSLPSRQEDHLYSKPEWMTGGAAIKFECPLCDCILPNANAARTHIDEHYPRDSPVCPVVECAKRFSHPNSVRNHMRSKHAEQWEVMKQIKWTL